MNTLKTAAAALLVALLPFTHGAFADDRGGRHDGGRDGRVERYDQDRGRHGDEDRYGRERGRHYAYGHRDHGHYYGPKHYRARHHYGHKRYYRGDQQYRHGYRDSGYRVVQPGVQVILPLPPIPVVVVPKVRAPKVVVPVPVPVVVGPRF